MSIGAVLSKEPDTRRYYDKKHCKRMSSGSIVFPNAYKLRAFSPLLFVAVFKTARLYDVMVVQTSITLETQQSSEKFGRMDHAFVK